MITGIAQQVWQNARKSRARLGNTTWHRSRDHLDDAPLQTCRCWIDFQPPHLLIEGGSYIGLEFAQRYLRFGSEVTVIEMGPRLIPPEDEEAEHQIYREDAVLEYPQSGERIRGRRNIQASRFAQPSRKRFIVRRILGAADLWITDSSLPMMHSHLTR